MYEVKDWQDFSQRMEKSGFVLSQNKRTPYIWITPANPGEGYPRDHLGAPRVAASLAPSGRVTFLNEIESGMREYQEPIRNYFSQ